jgi:hypothetical protein
MVRPIGAASVRPGTSTFPDTLATSPDAVRKPPSRKTWASCGIRTTAGGHRICPLAVLRNCLKPARSVTKCDGMLGRDAPDPPFGATLRST